MIYDNTQVRILLYVLVIMYAVKSYIISDMALP